MLILYSVAPYKSTHLYVVYLQWVLSPSEMFLKNAMNETYSFGLKNRDMKLICTHIFGGKPRLV